MNAFWSSYGWPALFAVVVAALVLLRDNTIKIGSKKLGDWWHDRRTTKESARKKYEKLWRENYLKIYAASGNLHGDTVTVMNQNTENNLKAQALAMIELTDKERRLLGLN